eukprot:719346-Alexandrium_andersonii.AAC.1
MRRCILGAARAAVAGRNNYTRRAHLPKPASSLPRHPPYKLPGPPEQPLPSPDSAAVVFWQCQALVLRQVQPVVESAQSCSHLPKTAQDR